MKKPSWSIISDKYEEWAAQWQEQMDRMLGGSSASVRSLVFLALLENRGRRLCYADLCNEISVRGVVTGEIPPQNLRVAVFEITRVLDDGEHEYRLGKRRKEGGREAEFILEEAKGRESRTRPQDNKGTKYQVIAQYNSESNYEPVLAAALVRDLQLQPKQMFVLSDAVKAWQEHSKLEKLERTGHEMSWFDNLLGSWRTTQLNRNPEGICLLGLNVGGEGEAELRMVRELLDEYSFESARVYYLATGLSDHLLQAHEFQLIEQFNREIEEGKLRCGVVAGDFEHDARALIRSVREAASRLYPGDAEFFPENLPVLCSYLGNYIGNTTLSKTEWGAFRAVLETFEKHPAHAFFIGYASVLREQGKIKPEEYPESWYAFLGKTPRQLLVPSERILDVKQSDTKADPASLVRDRAYLVLELGTDDNDAYKKALIKEFSTSKELSDKPAPGHYDVKILPYLGADYRVKIVEKDGTEVWEEGRVQGFAYSFGYTTLHAIRAAGTSIKPIPPETRLQLYRIIKFVPETLARFLSQRLVVIEPKRPETDACNVDLIMGVEPFEHCYSLLGAHTGE